jgi:hypothetical protein
MLGIFVGIIFIKQGHNLAHHHRGWIVAQFLRHRDWFDIVHGEPTSVEFHNLFRSPWRTEQALVVCFGEQVYPIK